MYEFTNDEASYGDKIGSFSLGLKHVAPMGLLSLSYFFYKHFAPSGASGFQS
jgi:hypothetical protein